MTADLVGCQNKMYITASCNAKEFTAHSFRYYLWKTDLVLHSDVINLKGCILLLPHMMYVFAGWPLVGVALQSEFLRRLTCMSILRVLTYLKSIICSWMNIFRLFVVTDRVKWLKAFSKYGLCFPLVLLVVLGFSVKNSYPVVYA